MHHTQRIDRQKKSIISGGLSMLSLSIQLEPGNKVVVFVHRLKEGLSAEQLAEYRRMDNDTLAVAMGMDGYLGHECVSNEEGTVFMSYWRDDAAVAEWSRHPLHREAKAKGQAAWYASYRTAICTVDRHHLHA